MKVKKLLYLLLTIVIASSAIDVQAVHINVKPGVKTQITRTAKQASKSQRRIRQANKSSQRRIRQANKSSQRRIRQANKSSQRLIRQANKSSQRRARQVIKTSQQRTRQVTHDPQYRIGDHMNMHPYRESLTRDDVDNPTTVLSRSKTSITSSDGKKEDKNEEGTQEESNEEPMNGPYKSKENKSHNGHSQEKDDSHGHGHGHHDNSNSCDSTTNKQQCHIMMSTPISIKRTVLVDSISSSQNQLNEWTIRQENNSSYRKDVDSSKEHSSREKRFTPENLILPNDTTKCEETDTTRIQ